LEVALLVCFKYLLPTQLRVTDTNSNGPKDYMNYPAKVAWRHNHKAEEQLALTYHLVDRAWPETALACGWRRLAGWLAGWLTQLARRLPN
jgi:hypothetical protein